MLRNQELRKVLLCLGLEIAALMGAPMRPDEIEDLLRIGQQAKIEWSSREDRKESEDPVLALEGAEPSL